MTTIETTQEPNTSLKFYSQKNITLATFFGGPLAAGVLVRQNFITLGDEKRGQYALIISILATILLFVGIFTIPEHILNKVPNVVIPALYTGIIYLVVESIHGEVLDNHKENNGIFYTGWKAAGIGLVSLVIMVAGIFAYAYLAPDDFDMAKYDTGIEQFHQNEERALELFTVLESSDTQTATAFIQKTGIPAWEENLKIIHALDTIKGLYPELKEHNQFLIEYSNLRIESYELIRKALSEGTDMYDDRIFEINDKIEELLKT